jgi:PAS domain S-box-containing protein
MGWLEVPTGALLDAAPDAMLVVDSAGRIRAANRLVTALFGYEIEEVVGQLVEILVPTELHSVHTADRDGYVADPTQRPMGTGQQLSASRRDGTRFPVQISLSPMQLDGDLFVVAAIRDMSLWVTTERELAAARRRRTIAEEHERIGRDLHDTVIQELFAIGMSLQAVHGEAQPERVAARIALAVDALDDTIRQIRSTIFELSSSGGVGSLRNELRQLVESIGLSLGFEPALTLIGPLDQLPEDITAHVVPTVREGLTNVARHAIASRAEVLVQLDGHLLRVEVRDDGIGMPEGPARSSGLANLGRRASELGGSMIIRGNGDRGTLLAWTVPVASGDDYS